MALLNFNAQDYDPSQGLPSLPLGKHKVVAVASETKENKAGTGRYLQYTLRIVEGPQAGLEGSYILNIFHNDSVTKEIANRQLSALCHVTGVYTLEDSSQLHDIPFVIEVVPQKSDPQYTEVKRVFDVNGNEPGKQEVAAQPAQQPALGQSAAQQADRQVSQQAPWGGAAQQAHQQPAQQTPWGQ